MRILILGAGPDSETDFCDARRDPTANPGIFQMRDYLRGDSFVLRRVADENIMSHRVRPPRFAPHDAERLCGTQANSLTGARPSGLRRCMLRHDKAKKLH